jgi:hypothetical protein
MEGGVGDYSRSRKCRRPMRDPDSREGLYDDNQTAVALSVHRNSDWHMVFTPADSPFGDSICKS